MRRDDDVALLQVRGQRHDEGQPALVAPAVKGEANGVGVRHVALDRFEDGRMQFGDRALLANAGECRRDRAEVVAPRCGR